MEEKRKEVVEIYNSSCHNLSQIQKITDKRKKAIDEFLKEFSIEQLRKICSIADSSNFLIGHNDRGWKADFDFIMRTDKATAILEGKYNNSKNNTVEQQEVKEETEEEKKQRKIKELEEHVHGNK